VSENHDEVGIDEARANLSELVNRVAFGGERITITRRGRPLVDLVPHSDNPSDTDTTED
jgi:prevent-host-death family protein